MPEAVRDPFFFLLELNKASVVMATEQGIVEKELGARIAQAIHQILTSTPPGAKPRAADYLAFENKLIEIGGSDMSRLHSGRSRQDIGATIERLALRDLLLLALERLNASRFTLLAMAMRHRDAIMPAYTWGVQAQPTSFGHYILAYCEALSRTAERMKEAYGRLNKSPYGSAALGTSSFPVNRQRLAELLGMDGLVVNSFDATQIAAIDGGAELAGLAATTALTVGAFVADLTPQYTQTHPWIAMQDGALTGISSIMPQKRNPRGLVMLRALASTVIGQAQMFFLLAHNVQSGMSDYKPFIVEPEQGHAPLTVMRDLNRLLDGFETILGTLVFDPQRAVDEVNADYSTTTELADVLQREADVPFRVGHHFASELVSHGRKNRLRPSEFPYGAAQAIFAEAARVNGLDKTRLPLSEAEFRKALSAENMVRSSLGTGGPQPAEVARMLTDESTSREADGRWLDETRAKQAVAAAAMQDAFEQLRRAA